MDGMVLGFFLLAAFLGAVTTGLAGFAMGLVVSGIWLHILTPVQTVTLMVSYSVLLQGYGVWKLRRALAWRRVAPFIMGGVIGVPIGAVLLGHINAAHLRTAVGVVLLLYSIYYLARPALEPVQGGVPADLVIGFLNGLLGGLTGLVGTVVVISCQLRGWPKDVQDAGHAAQGREVRHARRGAGHAEHELERAEENHEDARLHRNRREDQHDHAPREIHPEGEQQSVERARGAQGRDGRAACDRSEHQLGERSRDEAGKIVKKEVARAEEPLDVAPEHVQPEHVEEDVRDPAVQETVGDELPDPESVPWRPQCEPCLQQPAGRGLKEEDRDVGDQEGLRDGRHGRGREVTPLGVRSSFAQSAYLTRMRAMRDFSPLQFANPWQICLASPSGRSVNFSAKRDCPASSPGCTRLSCQGCLGFSAPM